MCPFLLHGRGRKPPVFSTRKTKAKKKKNKGYDFLRDKHAHDVGDYAPNPREDDYFVILPDQPDQHYVFNCKGLIYKDFIHC